MGRATLLNESSKMALTTVTAFEAKTRFGELLKRVAAGKEIVITRHGEPVARVVLESTTRRHDVRDAVAGLRALRERIRQRTRGRHAKLSEGEVRAAIDDGRR